MAHHFESPVDQGPVQRLTAAAGFLAASMLAVLAVTLLVDAATGGTRTVGSTTRGAVLGGLLAGLAVAVAGLAGLVRTGRTWRPFGGPCGVGLGALAVAGGLVVALGGEPAGAVLIAFAVCCSGALVPGRRALAFVGAGGWALWSVSLAVGVADGALVPDGGLDAWVLCSAGIVLALVPAEVAITARTRERVIVEAARARAEEVAVVDHLTGAANRQGLAMIAGPMIENARRQGQAVHCLYVDVEEFRQVNEIAGNAVGDDLLRAVAEALRGSTRLTDVVARWEADEFVVMGPGTGTSPLEMERRLRKRLTQSAPVPADVWTPRVSVGSSTLVPWDEGDLADLTRRADEDMHLRRSLRRRTRLSGRTPAPDGAGRDGGNASAVG